MTNEAVQTPWGSFRITTDKTGRLLACVPGDGAPPLSQAARELQEYLNGGRRQFDIPLDPPGTDFQKSVWRLLGSIPYGTTTTYRTLAQQLGSAPRAVGRAVGSNPLCIFIPCHRVLGSDGTLTGYAYGLPMKSDLLRLESTVAHTEEPRPHAMLSIQ